MARARSGTFNLTSEERGGRSLAIHPSGDARNQTNSLQRSSTPSSGRGLTAHGGQSVCLNCHSGNLEVSNRHLWKRRLFRLGVSSARKQMECWRRQVAQGPRAHPPTLISKEHSPFVRARPRACVCVCGGGGGQVLDASGPITSALGERAQGARRPASPCGLRADQSGGGRDVPALLGLRRGAKKPCPREAVASRAPTHRDCGNAGGFVLTGASQAQVLLLKPS